MKIELATVDEEVKQILKNMKGYTFTSKENEHCYYDIGSVGGYGLSPLIYLEKANRKRIRVLTISTN